MKKFDILDQQITAPKFFIEAYRAANRVQEVEIILNHAHFTRLFTIELKSVKVSVKPLGGGGGRLIVGNMIWVWIVSPQADVQQILAEMKAQLREAANIMHGYVLVLGEELTWKATALSETFLLQQRNMEVSNERN